MTTALGIVGALVATYLGQALGWYQPGEQAGFIGAIVGAIIILSRPFSGLMMIPSEPLRHALAAMKL